MFITTTQVGLKINRDGKRLEAPVSGGVEWSGNFSNVDDYRFTGSCKLKTISLKETERGEGSQKIFLISGRLHDEILAENVNAIPGA
jgi:hypothetical protein